jgi:hypothetical protein
MEIFIVSFIVFGVSALVLVGVQRLRRGPLPVGCTPESGRCCRDVDAAGRCRQRISEGS